MKMKHPHQDLWHIGCTMPRMFFLKRKNTPQVPVNIQLVTGIPPEMERYAGSIEIKTRPADALIQMLASARQVVRILSPFIDSAVTPIFLRHLKCRCRLITSCMFYRKARPNPVIHRLSSSVQIEARYVDGRKTGVSMFSGHGKIIIADAVAMYLGSANLTDTGLYYNFEIGAIIRSPPAVTAMIKYFDFIYDNIAVQPEVFWRKP